MSDLPDPLVPPNCDLRGLEWMPLDVVSIMDSDLFLEATGDEFKAAFALWCKSWRQVPAGSLPNKESVLAGLSGAKSWKKVREVAMRNWVLCSDNRWYHPIVAAKALEAWPSRQAFENKKTAEAERKAKERADRSALFELLRANNIVPPYDTKTSQLRELAKPFQTQPVTQENVTSDVTNGVTCHGTVTARTGTPQGQGEGQGRVNQEQNLPAAVPATAPKERQPNPEAQEACRATWEGYAGAYRQRYGTLPVRNAKLNTQIAQFVKRLGFTEAPQVAAFYVTHQDQFYGKKLHDFGMALNDAEKLRTEWATGRTAPQGGTHGSQANRESFVAAFTGSGAAGGGNVIDGSATHVSGN